MFEKIKKNGICGYNWKYTLTHPWVILEKAHEEIIFAWQRVFRGWDNKAVWAVDHYLAELIPQLIRELKVVERGIPLEMFEEDDWDEENFCYKEGALEKASVKWDLILDEIAEGFEEYSDLTGFCNKNALESEKFNRAFDLFREHFGSLWW